MSKSAATIMIVDDTPEDRETYKDLLEQTGERLYSFLEADDAESGLDIAASVELDCILLDFSLPGMDGLQFLHSMQERNTRLGMHVPPVVMITGRGSESIAVDALKNGAADYLVKSDVTADSLFRAAKNAIDRSELEKALEVQELRRVRSENELRESEERYRLLVDAVKDYALVMLDDCGRIVSWNSGARRLLGYHDGEIIGQHYRKLFISSDIKRQVPEAELKEAAIKGRVVVERVHVKRNSHSFWTEGTLTSIRDETGGLKGFVKVFKDNSDLKVARQERMTSESRLSLVLDASPFGILVFEGRTGKLLFFNKALAQLFGHTFVPDCGRVPGCFIDASGNPLTLLGLDDLISGKLLESTEVEWDLGHRKIPVALHVGKLSATDVYSETLVVFIQDLTQAKENAVELKNAVDARDEFLSVASHELKSPITSLKLQAEIFARVAKNGLQAAHAASAVEIIGRQSEKLNDIVTGLLDVARLNAGTFRVDRYSTDLAGVVDSAVARMKEELSLAGCEVLLKLHSRPRGDWDEKRLMQVVENLLSNVTKYAPGKPVEVLVDSDGTEAVLSVRDRGQGIPPFSQDIIFERFSRARGSNRVSGLGLGLFIAKRIVDAHGGEIAVNSVPGEGAEFIVRLPLGSAETNAGVV